MSIEFDLLSILPQALVPVLHLKTNEQCQRTGEKPHPLAAFIATTATSGAFCSIATASHADNQSGRKWQSLPLARRC